MKIYYLASVLLIAGLIGCDVYSQDEYQEYYVVESYLIADNPLQQVRLSTTAPIDQFYSFSSVAVAGADVQVRLLAPDGATVEDIFTYSSDSAGIYYPDQIHQVQPLRTYELFITIPGANEEVSAKAFVPDTFSVLSQVLDTLIYQSTEQLEVTVAESIYPGRQNIFIFNTLSLQPTIENLTPIYAELLDLDEPEDIQEASNTSSGLLNAANFTQNSDGSTTIRYPWIAVAFYGDNNIVASTVDDNLYDYIRSADVQLGGSTLSPGEIQNVITNVKGGIGIFGALASDTIQTFIKPPLPF